MMHAPWYNSNSGHEAEAELMRRDMEMLLYNYSVDIVLCAKPQLTRQPWR